MGELQCGMDGLGGPIIMSFTDISVIHVCKRRVLHSDRPATIVHVELFPARDDKLGPVHAATLCPRHILILPSYLRLNHTQLALVLFSQLSAAVMRHKPNDGVVYATRAWFKYDTALSAVV